LPLGITYYCFEFLLFTFEEELSVFFSSFITSFRNSSSSFDADNLTCGTTSSLAASIESLLNFAYSSSPLSTFEWIVYRHHFSLTRWLMNLILKPIQLHFNFDEEYPGINSLKGKSYYKSSD
jgi:hypothetical protein